jgi:uncharacterized protein YjiK
MIVIFPNLILKFTPTNQYMSMRYLGFIILLIGFMCSCSSKSSGSKEKSNFTKACTQVSLPRELDEVSGLTYVGQDVLLSINDEKGKFYYINSSTGDIMEEFVFAKNGDYEGICQAGEEIFVLKSNGDIYAWQNGETEKYKSPYRGNIDFEGLTLDSKNNRLLLAAKDFKGDGKDVFLFGFDLENRKFDKKPTVKIDRSFIGKNFKCSGIVNDAKSNKWYLLSSATKELVVLNSVFMPVTKIRLPKSMFPQPEGICLSPTGEIYIANEKNNRGSATLIKHPGL